MLDQKKRSYKSEIRSTQTEQTKESILVSARMLLQTEGFDGVTIERLAQTAGVAAATIYAQFKSKRGILYALMQQAFPSDAFEALVEEAKRSKSVEKYLAITAKIARQINEAERSLIDVFRAASVIAPELKRLEKEKEKQRYAKLEDTVQRMFEEKVLKKGMSFSQAHSILWAFTGRDMYRLFVVERGWSSDEYEQWLSKTLYALLIDAADFK